jgi:hypothetical protein
MRGNEKHIECEEGGKMCYIYTHEDEDRIMEI